MGKGVESRRESHENQETRMISQDQGVNVEDGGGTEIHVEKGHVLVVTQTNRVQTHFYVFRRNGSVEISTTAPSVAAQGFMAAVGRMLTSKPDPMEMTFGGGRIKEASVVADGAVRVGVEVVSGFSVAWP
jgi:hypothetical protein